MKTLYNRLHQDIQGRVDAALWFQIEMRSALRIYDRFIRGSGHGVEWAVR